MLVLPDFGFHSHRLPNLLRAPLATHVSLRSVESDRDGVRTGPRSRRRARASSRRTGTRR